VNIQSETEGPAEGLRDIIVIGASAGGLQLLRKLAAAFPPNLNASVFVVLHTAPDGPGYVAEILGTESKIPTLFPKDGDVITPRRIYVAPPDHHMMVDAGRIVVVRGPRENRFRPAIDPLFRSAAVHYGPRVIGVILSGMLDDGASGLLAIKQCGGTAVVQDPVEADYPEMIENARSAVKPDFVVSVSAMPDLFANLMREPVKMNNQDKQSEDRLRIEADLAAMRRTGAENTAALGKLSRLVCPECSGSLWELDDEHILRFRCHIGHAFSAQSLAADQSSALERALSIALRTLDDTAALAGRLAQEAEQKERTQSALIFRHRRDEAKQNADLIRGILSEQESLRSQVGEEVHAQPQPTAN
jgi:two-component system, chemotaxis family, protein-glutamate methylesterase/glutaminase